MAETTKNPILVEAAIAADYLEEHTNFAEAAALLRRAVFVDLLEFCDLWGTRFATHEPFVRDGYLYATDARIAIRIPTSRPNTFVEARYPDMKNVFRQFAQKPPEELPIEGWRRWPDKPFFVEVLPEAKTGIACPHCRGAGYYHAGGDSIPCLYCDRTGDVEAFDDVLLVKTFIAGLYWDLIRRLPQVWYREPQTEEAPVHFVFRYGEGLLMPVDHERRKVKHG